MSILTYKQYKLLHENLDSVIGISTPANVGLQSEAPQLYGMMSKMSKKMDGGMGMPPMMAGKKKPALGGDMGDDLGSDLGGPLAGGPDDEEGMGGPPMGDDDEDMDMDDAEGDMDDAEGDMDDAEDDMDDAEGDMDDAEGDLDDAEGDMDDEEGLGDDMGGDMGPLGAGSPPPGMGGPMAGPDMGMGLGGPPPKKKPKMMSGMNYMRKEAADPQDAKMKGQNRKNGANDQNDCGPGPASKKTTTVREAGDPQDAKMKGQNKKNGANDQNDCGPGPASKKTTTVREGKCCDKCGNMMSKKCNKMTKEQREFNDSLKRQTGGALKFKQDEYGYWVPVKEDVLVQKQQPVQQDNEPGPGEVGFAPQSKIGILGSNFSEWANRYKK